MKPVAAAALAANSRAQSQASFAAVALRARRQSARSQLERARRAVVEVLVACGLDDHQARCIRAATSTLEKAAVQAGAAGADADESAPLSDEPVGRP